MTDRAETSHGDDPPRVPVAESRRALPDTEELFHSFVRASPDGIVIIDGQGTILEWNDGEARITGVPRSEVIGQPLWDVQYRLAPDEVRTPALLRIAREAVLAAVREGLGLNRVIESEIQRADGTRCFVQSSLFALCSGGRLLAGSTSRDITERRRLERALRSVEEDLKRAQAVAHVGSWRIDVRHNALEWSEETYRIFGIPPGRPMEYDGFLDLVHADDRARVDDCWQAALGGAPYDVEHRIVVGAEVRWVRELARLEFGRDGALTGAFGTVQDISDRKAMEQALADASRRKDEFLAVLSHELRNPLAPLRTAAYVLDRAEPGGEQARRMQAIIERQVSHLTRLVDDLLDVTRIARGKVRLQKHRVELGDLVGRAVEDFRCTFMAAGIRIETRLPPQAVWLTADPTRLSQVVGNLLANAAKFTPTGCRVEVALEQRDAEALLRVRDDGVGITADVLERVFEPFVQADQTLDRARGGLGLGLALVRELVQLHGGEVSAASGGPGRGAEFTVRLPLDHARAPAEVADTPRPS